MDLSTLLPWTADHATDAETPEAVATPETEDLATRVTRGDFDEAIDAALDALVESKPYLTPQPVSTRERRVGRGLLPRAGTSGSAPRSASVSTTAPGITPRSSSGFPQRPPIASDPPD